MITLSPGLAQGCFELLGIASRNALTFPQIHASFAYLGSLSASTVIETAQGLKWLQSNDEGIAVITPSGLRLLAISGYEPMLLELCTSASEPKAVWKGRPITKSSIKKLVAR